MPLRLHFPRLSRFDRTAEPIRFAAPFPQGALRPEEAVAVAIGDRSVPTQARPTATWPDGSVKWLLVDALVDLPGSLPGLVEHVVPVSQETLGDVRRRIGEKRHDIDLGVPEVVAVVATAGQALGRDAVTFHSRRSLEQLKEVEADGLLQHRSTADHDIAPGPEVLYELTLVGKCSLGAPGSSLL
mgnify:CR=1 FL=1